MKVVLAGGTGFIGRVLIDTLRKAGVYVVVLTRNSQLARAASDDGVRFCLWDGVSVGAWADEVDDADCILNFAGENIAGKRWSKSNRSRILQSRVQATAALVKAVQRAKDKPRCFISASAVGYYGNTGENRIVEKSPAGTGFLAQVCVSWEKEAQKVSAYGARLVVMRLGVVVGSQGGIVSKMKPLFKWFLGAVPGCGKAWMPWVHIDDLTRAVLFTMTNTMVSGPYNIVAPGTVRHKEFCTLLARILNRPCFLKIPKTLLKEVFGEMSSLFLEGQLISSEKIVGHGYSFAYSCLEEALRDAVQVS